MFLASINEYRSRDLSNNQLTGPFPSEISQLLALQKLFLGGNEFTGTMPQHLAEETDTPSGFVFSNAASPTGAPAGNEDAGIGVIVGSSVAGALLFLATLVGLTVFYRGKKKRRIRALQFVVERNASHCIELDIDLEDELHQTRFDNQQRASVITRFGPPLVRENRADVEAQLRNDDDQSIGKSAMPRNISAELSPRALEPLQAVLTSQFQPVQARSKQPPMTPVAQVLTPVFPISSASKQKKKKKKVSAIALSLQECETYDKKRGVSQFFPTGFFESASLAERGKSAAKLNKCGKASVLSSQQPSTVHTEVALNSSKKGPVQAAVKQKGTVKTVRNSDGLLTEVSVSQVKTRLVKRRKSSKTSVSKLLSLPERTRQLLKKSLCVSSDVEV